MNPPEGADEIFGSEHGEDGQRPAVITSAIARRTVGELLERAGIRLDGVLAADALLVTSELVTNAIRHGGGLTHFHTAVLDDVLHLEVGDANPLPPTVRSTGRGRPGGYGWPLVQTLTDHIDVTPLPTGGKTITIRQRLAVSRWTMRIPQSQLPYGVRAEQ
ncbi:ATP-binding protein [Streptomyces sp. NPDC057939]|uniref:ATP-binding protein n=1 Tax=Streptomyces sp. NPDC057939 TaxID=3346284 RepID=UPI0036ECA169